jgi:hypothetical protein
MILEDIGLGYGRSMLRPYEAENLESQFIHHTHLQLIHAALICGLARR